MWRSVPQTEAACTRTRISPSPGSGMGTSTSSAPGPGRTLRSACIVADIVFEGTPARTGQRQRTAGGTRTASGSPGGANHPQVPVAQTEAWNELVLGWRRRADDDLQEALIHADPCPGRLARCALLARRGVRPADRGRKRREDRKSVV